MPSDYSTGGQLTHEQLIAQAVDALKNDNKTDTKLLNVLSEHIVTLNPNSTAVSDAVAEIQALAEKRAEEPKDDQSN